MSQDLPTSTQDLLQLLDGLGMSYEIYDHEPIFKVEDGEHLKVHIPGLHCRNLFVRDKKQAMFLAVLGNDTAVDLKALQTYLGCGRLSFGSPDRLWRVLGIRPGSVSPFCLVNDKECDVHVLLDHEMMEAELVNYHPMDNAKTIAVRPQDLLDFLSHTGHNYEVVDFGALEQAA